MARTQDHKLLLQQLKKQVKRLKKQEEQTKNKLRAAVKKAHSLANTYQMKLAKKTQAMQDKISAVKALSCAQVTAEIEKHLKKSIARKGKILSTVIAKLESQHLIDLVKKVAKKGRQVFKEKKMRVQKKKRDSR